MMNLSDDEIIQEGLRVLAIESDAMKSLENSIDQAFVKAVHLILNCKGNVIFSGVGKSGHVGRKLAATFASTGTTAYFVHADEAAHGDMGMIRPNDIFIGLSLSGESNELQTIIPALKLMEIPIIAMTGNSKSSLARAADVCLLTSIKREACPLNLAPTASTTITMALGDALAGVLMVEKQFNVEDFARSHPAGALGRRLLLKTRDVMRPISELPLVDSDTSAIDAIGLMAKKHLGCFVVAENLQVQGIFTEGDLSRLIHSGKQLTNLKASDLMTREPKSIKQDESAFLAMNEIRKYQISQLIVLDDDDQIAGLVHIHDLIANKVS